MGDNASAIAHAGAAVAEDFAGCAGVIQFDSGGVLGQGVQEYLSDVLSRSYAADAGIIELLMIGVVNSNICDADEL